jgi:hypothetical protein
LNIIVGRKAYLRSQAATCVSASGVLVICLAYTCLTSCPGLNHPVDILGFSMQILSEVGSID